MAGNAGVQRRLLSGAVAGAASTAIFAAVHQALISDIWFSLLPMTTAGVACGVSIAWSYARLFPSPSVASWMGYNLLFVGMLMLLGVCSVVIYEPIANAAVLIAANEPPRELFGRAMPLTVGFVLVLTAGISVARARRPLDVVAVLVTCVVLLALLGMNVSVLGLVQFTGGEAYLVAELFALIAVLGLGYSACFALLERRWMRSGP
jgi:hypothetical protein